MPRRTTLDWILEAVSLAVLLMIFAMVAVHWPELPERVPRHYNARGVPNGWGEKNGLWILLATVVGVYALLTASSRYRGLIDLPISVDRNSPEIQSLLLRLTLYWKVTLMLTFAYITWAGINTAFGRANGLGRMFLPIVLAAIFGPLIFFTSKLLRDHA